LVTQGQKRYHAFLREAKNEGHTHKQAMQIYRVYKDSVGHIPKRGEYQRYHGLVDLALKEATPKQREQRERYREDTGRDVAVTPRETARALHDDWWDTEAMEEIFDESPDDDDLSEVA
jgi:hypothetical protein